MADALEKKTSNSQSSVSISPDGTAIRESQATITVDDGRGNTVTDSVSVSDSNPGGEDSQDAPDTMNDSGTNTFGEDSQNAPDTKNDSGTNTSGDDSQNAADMMDSDANTSGDDSQDAPDTINDSGTNTSGEDSQNAADAMNDLTNSAPSEDVSEARQAESSVQKALITQSFINNGSFEGDFFQLGEGTFERWRTIGDTSIETKEIGIAPTDKESQALITNGFSDSGGSVEESDLSEFFDLSSSTLDALLGGNATEGSGIKQQFTAQAGDILEFDYTLLTNEATPSKTFNDTAFFSLGKFVQKLSDTSDPTFSSDKNVKGYSEATDTQSLKILISEAGTYDLGFGIVDLTDTIVNSGILIDDVKLTSTGVSPFESQTIEGSDASKTDAAISGDVDLTFGSKGFEPAENSSNLQR
ncbi:MAG: hypothetical protein KI793_10225 [Rivularia sp. (in: Bacteria)]|nr:hypothetical protein [Rivularia sp. MS3]